jgi:hypothetical protein
MFRPGIHGYFILAIWHAASQLPFLGFPLRSLVLGGLLRSALLLFSLPLGGCLRSLLDRRKDIAEEDQQLRLEDELAIFPALLAPSL